MKNSRAMRWLVLAVVLIISAQLLFILAKGEPVCLNGGCRMVEGLTRITPFWFNLMGLVYFATLYALLVRIPAGGSAGSLLPMLLAAGLGAEGVLLGYQIVVAKAFCAYCLAIFSGVAALNLLAGLRQATGCIAGLAGVLAIFPLLRFGPDVAAASKLTLKSGTYGTLRSVAAGPNLYLFFSDGCEHCHKVMQHIQAEGECTINFNPIGKIRNEPVPGLEKPADYAPDVNRAMLSFLGIEEIPVLIEHNAETFRVIKGEKSIISFLKETCIKASPQPLPPESPQEEGKCLINSDKCVSE